MKVLFINTVYGKGSTGRIIADIGSVLENMGHQFKVLYGRGSKVDDEHVYYIGTEKVAKVHAALTRLTDRCGFFSTSVTKKAISFIKEYNPDIIHLHNLHGYYINIKVLFDYLKNEFQGEVIWTLHDCWAFTGHCTHFTYAKCDRWRTQCFCCPEKRRYPASVFIDASKSNYSNKRFLFTGVPNLTIVTPSAWLKNQVKDSFLNNYNCVVINNGIDLDVFRPMDEYRKKEKKVILNVVDGLDERKGYKDLIELGKILPKDYQIVIVGLNKKKLIKIKNVTTLCRTNNTEELVNYYNQAKIVVNPTYEDTFPTVNIEALACGIPVVTYNSGGSPEMIDDKCGVVVEVGDIKNIANVIVQEEFLVEDCRSKAKNYDKWEKYKEYVELYENLLVTRYNNEVFMI